MRRGRSAALCRWTAGAPWRAAEKCAAQAAGRSSTAARCTCKRQVTIVLVATVVGMSEQSFC